MVAFKAFLLVSAFGGSASVFCSIRAGSGMGKCVVRKPTAACRWQTRCCSQESFPTTATV